MALLSQRSTSRHKHIFKRGLWPNSPKQNRKLQALCSVFARAVFTASSQSEEESSVRWTLSYSFTHLSRKTFPSLSHHKIPTVPSNVILSQQKKTVQKSAISQRYCVLFLLTHQVRPTKQTTRSVASIGPHTSLRAPNAATWLYWRKALIKTEPH